MENDERARTAHASDACMQRRQHPAGKAVPDYSPVNTPSFFDSFGFSL